jgi:hypothetical protein
MKIHRITYLGVALAIPQLATATVPMPAQHLGQIEGILDYCGKVNPEGASKYKELKKLMDGDASANQLAEARAKKEYKDSYKDITDQFAKLPKESVVKQCTTYLEVAK